MDVAVLSDIHGNIIALEQCLEYAISKNVKTFIFLGDYVGEFPYPQKTMDFLYSMKDKYSCYFMRGNKEDYWLNQQSGSNKIVWKAGSSSTGALKYCYDHLSKKDLDFFIGLSISNEICFEDMEPLLACHGSPKRNNEKMIPDDENTKNILKQCQQKYILYGHTYIQQVILSNEKIAINPGAVGVSLHSKGKAQFAILHSQGREWSYELVSLDYNKALVKKDIRESGIDKAAPYWMKITEHLIDTGELSHGTVLSRAMKFCMEENEDCKWYDIPEKYWKMAVEEFTMEKRVNEVGKRRVK